MWSLEIKTWHQYWTDVSNFLLTTLVVEISRCYLVNDVSNGYWQTFPVVINGIYVSMYCRKWNKESQLNIWFVKIPKYIFTGVCDIAHNSLLHFLMYLCDFKYIHSEDMYNYYCIYLWSIWQWMFHCSSTLCRAFSNICFNSDIRGCFYKRKKVKL